MTDVEEAAISTIIMACAMKKIKKGSIGVEQLFPY